MIKVENLCKTYKDGTKALSGVGFEISEGEICGYIGVNGAGKSTTMRILCGIIDFDEGIVDINGFRLPACSLDVKRIAGYVPETTELFNSLKVNEYFEFIKRIRGIDGLAFKRRINYFAGLFAFAEYLEQPIGKLSKGNKQKVAIVSSLLHNPDILLFDEPLTGLDPFSIAVFQDMLIKLAEKKKVIFYSSHLLDLMEKVSSRIIIIDKGIVTMNRTTDELSGSPDYKNLSKYFQNISSPDTQKEFSYDEVFG